MPRSIPCRFHLQGKCIKGEECAFYHGPEPAPTEAEVCKFFQRGFCANGDHCRFWHPSQGASTRSTQRSDVGGSSPQVLHQEGCGAWGDAELSGIDDCEWADELHWEERASMEGNADADTDDFDQEAWELWASVSSGPEWRDRNFCPVYQMNGRCPRWRSCPYPHGHLCEVCKRWSLHPYSESQRIEHTQQCAERADREHQRLITASQECCICLERVVDKPFAERRFGLLQACDHPFCLACVRSWRSNVEGGADVDTALRSCPVCRQVSHFVTPSKVWPRTSEEKATIVSDYKRMLATIDCKYWDIREKSCPFGTSCFYRHAGAEDMSPPRKYVSADGHVKYGNPVQLSEFLSTLGM